MGKIRALQGKPRQISWTKNFHQELEMHENLGRQVDCVGKGDAVTFEQYIAGDPGEGGSFS